MATGDHTSKPSAMILYQWHGDERNFGDELNSLLWPRLLPNFFDQNEDAQFLGIGSILDDRHDRFVTKLVAGSGYGGYQAPAVLDQTWAVHWVRGPRTARLMGLPPELGLGDPGSLLPLAGLAPTREFRDIGFMPHFESASRGAWAEASSIAGMTLIDPRGDPTAIVAAIGKCRVLMSEALHGVIVADALRVPWIALQPLAPVHRSKWLDWAETLDLCIDFSSLASSTALERAHLTRVSRFHTGRMLLTRHAARLRNIRREQYIGQAVEALHAASRAEPRLSRDTLLDEAQTRMMEAIAVLRRAPRPGEGIGVRQPARKPLQARAVSAYLDMPGRLPA
jgi:hypothetical protein